MILRFAMLAALLLLALTACGDDEEELQGNGTPTPEPGTSGPTETPDATATPSRIEFQTFLEGTNSGLTLESPMLEKITTQGEWQDFWSRHQSIVDPTTPPPAFDFEGRMLLALVDMDQPTGGYAIQIQDIVEESGNLTVEALRTIPGPGCIVTQAFTQPFHIVALESVETDPELNLTEQVTVCE